MNKIIVLVCFFLISGLATASAYDDFTTNTYLTPPSVSCSDCHSDGRTWAMFHNLYDSTNNRVHLPVVYVAGAYYSADLVLVQTQPTFRFRAENVQSSQTLPSISLSSTYYDSARVVFNATTLQLMIPNITVGTQNYSVNLTLVPGVPDIEFQL